MTIVAQTNSIIRDWKNGYIESANNLFPELNISKQLSNKSYAKIMTKTAVEVLKLCNNKNDSTMLQYLTSIMIVYNIDKTIGGFNKNPEVFKLYQSVFGNIKQMAIQFVLQGINIDSRAPKESAYIITPLIPPLGIIAPIGIRPIEKVPEFLEIFFETDNEEAHLIDDVIFVYKTRGFTFKAVEKLPQDMLIFAKENNIKLR